MGQPCVVERAVQEKSLKINDDEGSRLLNNMQSSMDKAQSAREEMTESLQTAQSYREIAQRANEHLSSVNSNLSQVFKNWLVEQPGTNGKGRLGHAMAESILVNDPMTAQHYAENFSQHYTQQLLKENYNKQMPESQNDVQHQLNKHQYQINEEKIQTDFKQHHTKVKNTAKQNHLDDHFKIDESSKNQSQKMIKNHQQIIQQEHQHIQTEGQKRIEKVEHENKRHPERESNFFKEVFFEKNIDTTE